MKLKSLLMTILFVALFAIQGQSQAIPDINLTKLDGSTVNMNSYAANGKITIFCFWATWCVPCKKELDNLKELYSDWTSDYDVEIIAVSTDDSKGVSGVPSMVAAKNWPFTVVLDTNSEFKRALGGNAIPYTVITNKQGLVVDSHTGYVEGDEYDLEDEIDELN